MATVTLELVTQRDPYWMFYGRSDNLSTNIDDVLNFPTGIFDVLGGDVELRPVSGEAVAIENHPGVLSLNTTGGNHNGNVPWVYGAHFYDVGFFHTFRAGTAMTYRLEAGDYMKYMNTDLETGSTMDAHYWIFVQSLR